MNKPPAEIDFRQIYAAAANGWCHDEPLVRDDLLGWNLISIIVRDLAPHNLILDIGCGTGNIARLVKQYATRVIGIDNCPEMIAAAKIATSDADSLSYVIADMRDFADVVESVSCNMVLSIFGFCCLSSPNDLMLAMRESARVLKPNGHMLVQIPHPSQPFLSQQSEWAKDDMVPTSYFQEGFPISRTLRTTNANKQIVVARHHFPLATYFAASHAADLVITRLWEPRADENLLQTFPALSHEASFPSSLVFLAQKSQV